MEKMKLYIAVFFCIAIGPVSQVLHTLFLQVWRTGGAPADWRDGIIVSLYKNKGSKAECSNYRPITLLSVPGKVFAHVLLGRVQPLLEATVDLNNLASLLEDLQSTLSSP